MTLQIYLEPCTVTSCAGHFIFYIMNEIESVIYGMIK